MIILLERTFPRTFGFIRFDNYTLTGDFVMLAISPSHLESQEKSADVALSLFQFFDNET